MGGKADFERWDWNKTLAAPLLPSFPNDKLIEEMQIPVAQNFAFSSPAFKAPSRYFDSLILKYRATESDIKAKIYWRYDGHDRIR